MRKLKPFTMKTYLFLFCMFFSQYTRAQVITSDDFFDIKEGDIFQTELAIGTNLNAGPVEYQIDSVQKILFRSPDSIAWESRFTRFFRMPNWPAGTYSSPVRGTSMYSKGHLSDTVRHDPSWCTKIKDTVYMSDKYCDFFISEFTSGQDNPFCQFTSIYVQGCGGPFVSQTSVDTSSGITYYSNKRLVYFYKDGKECGNLISKSEDTERNDDVILFPNPFYNEIQFENLSLGAQIQMYNVNGQLEVSAIHNGNPISTLLLPPGTYIILVRDGKQVISLLRTNKAW